MRGRREINFSVLALELGGVVYWMQSTPSPTVEARSQQSSCCTLSADLEDLKNCQKELVKQLSQISKIKE